jgi:hypothetical protein
MVGNSTVGATVVDAAGEHVTFNGDRLEAEPIDSVSLSRLYFL